MTELEQKHADDKAFILLENLIRTARNGYPYKELLGEFKEALDNSPTVRDYVRNLAVEVRPKLIQVDLGPNAGRDYKKNLFED